MSDRNGRDVDRPSPFAPYSQPQEAPATTKLLVAVHGIGDQTAYETIQSVALRVSAHGGRPVATPLGRFYLNRPGAPPAEHPMPTPQLMTDPDAGALQGIGLAEAYWAPIPRDIVSRKFILEETKRWARSIVGRVAYRGSVDKHWNDGKVEGLVVVLDEMVETIRVLERLTYLVEKAGVFKLDLGRLLSDFVGDVQIVADFQGYREKILKTFDETMERTLALVPEGTGELYIIAHSEGTVVAFAALLEALANPDAHPWVYRVKGLMTIGSPIEIHHLLWPALWRDRELAPSPKLKSQEIRWENYMDYGDPIAYELTETTKWLDAAPGFGKHLKPTTHAFSRYPLPGKAHVEYWADADVFGHFFDNVVQLGKPAGRVPAKLETLGKQCTNYVTGATGAVRSKLWVPTFTFILPYLIVAGLLFSGVYVLERAVRDAFGAAFAEQFTLGRVTADVIGIGSLLFGVTAASRLPRIAGHRGWTIAGWGVLLATATLFATVASPDTHGAMGAPLLALVGRNTSACMLTALPVSLGCVGGTGISASAFAAAVLAAAVAALSGLWTMIYPRRGHYMLPFLGLAAAASIIGSIWYANENRSDAAVGGIVLASMLFFYLWWLGAMLFDLVFVWRRYARHSALRQHLAEMG